MVVRISGKRPAGFIEFCRPVEAKPPIGDGWVHEIKFDGYRLQARREGDLVRLYTKNAHDWTERYPAIETALRKLKVKSCTIDGELVACDEAGVPIFDRLRSRRFDNTACVIAFDLLELDGTDLRRMPLIDRKKRLRHLLRRSQGGVVFSEHLEGEGALVFEKACELGFEGIISKRRDAPYRSGRSANWIKVKNPDHAAFRRPIEEQWHRTTRRGPARG